MFEQNKVIKDWNSSSDEYFGNTKFEEFFKRLKKDPYTGLPKAMSEILKEFFPSLEGKKVLIPSCGDNTAVFSFCALGADVTASDISHKQIENGRKIAANMNFNVEYHVLDSMKLEPLESDSYDLIYTSNGVHVWIDDLVGMYTGFHRLLKKGGMYMGFDTHPSVRPFSSKVYDGEFQVVKKYEDVGPFGEVPTFGWRTQDVVNALIRSGLILQRMEEFHSHKDDFSACSYLLKDDDPNFENFQWHNNPWAALPQCLGLFAYKKD